MSTPLPKPMGWLVGLAVLLITLGVIAGLVGITIVARKKQRFRINDSPVSPTNQIQPKPTNGAAWFPGETFIERAQGSHRDEPLLATPYRT